MIEKIHGVFKAIVTDTDIFKETGKIKTRVSMINSYYLGKDLRDGYDENSHKEGLEKDLLSLVLLPFGGGYDYGMFKLPPVNSLGLVTFIDGNPNLPIWIGGLPSILHTDTGVLHSVSPPSDDIFSDKSIIYFNEGNNDKEFNNESLNSFVIKTKNNSFDNLDNPEDMNWEKRRVENGIVLNENRMDFVHLEEEKHQRMIFSSPKEGEEDYSIKITDFTTDSDSSTFLLGEKGAKIEIKRGDILTEVSMSEGVLELNVNKGISETSIVQTEKEITLKNGTSIVKLKKQEGKDQVILKSETINLDSDNIILGNGGYKLVIAPNRFNLTLEDGTMLTTAKNVSV